jgi:hypothetical protein
VTCGRRGFDSRYSASLTTRQRRSAYIMAIVQTRLATERAPGPEPAGRTCAEDGCSTLLSTYNCGTTCALHGDGWPTNAQLSDMPPVVQARLEHRAAA